MVNGITKRLRQYSPRSQINNRAAAQHDNDRTADTIPLEYCSDDDSIHIQDDDHHHRVTSPKPHKNRLNFRRGRSASPKPTAGRKHQASASHSWKRVLSPAAAMMERVIKCKKRNAYSYSEEDAEFCSPSEMELYASIGEELDLIGFDGSSGFYY